MSETILIYTSLYYNFLGIRFN